MQKTAASRSAFSSEGYFCCCYRQQLTLCEKFRRPLRDAVPVLPTFPGAEGAGLLSIAPPRRDEGNWNFEVRGSHSSKSATSGAASSVENGSTVWANRLAGLCAIGKMHRSFVGSPRRGRGLRCHEYSFSVPAFVVTKGIGTLGSVVPTRRKARRVGQPRAWEWKHVWVTRRLQGAVGGLHRSSLGVLGEAEDSAASGSQARMAHPFAVFAKGWGSGC